MCIHIAVLFLLPRLCVLFLHLRIVVQSIGGSVTEPPPPVTTAVSFHSVPSHRRPLRDRAGTVRISPRSAWKQTTWKSEPELRVHRTSLPLHPRIPKIRPRKFSNRPRIRISIRAVKRFRSRSGGGGGEFLRHHPARNGFANPFLADFGAGAKRASLRTRFLAISRHPSQLHVSSETKYGIEANFTFAI